MRFPGQSKEEELVDRGEAGGRGAGRSDGGRKQMSEAGRFLGSSSAYS